MTHPCFTTRARELLARAGGDPDQCAALAAWAEDAHARQDARRGVLVAHDGTLVATTIEVPSRVVTGTYYIEKVLIDLPPFERSIIQRLIVGLALGKLQSAAGQTLIEVRYWDACTDLGRFPQSA